MRQKNQKNRKRRQSRFARPITLDGPQNLDDICQMVQRRELHLVIRGNHLFGGRFDGQPLPLSFYLIFQAHEQELLDLVRRNDVRLCIQPHDPTHTNSYRIDELGRQWCHACQTYRKVSEALRQMQN